MNARRWFHILLGGTFLPGLTLPLVWGFPIFGRRRAAEAEDQRWAKRILGLALVDTLLVVALGIMVAKHSAHPRERSASRPQVVIGITRGTSSSTLAVTPRWSNQLPRDHVGIFQPQPG